MKSAEETRDEFKAYLQISSASSGDQEQFAKLFDAHTNAVAYEAQQHTFIQLLDHAKNHMNDNIDHVAINAWRHEYKYIERCLEQLDRAFAAHETANDDMLEQLRAIFGPSVRIISTEELMNGLDASESTATLDTTPVDNEMNYSVAGQFNKFADKFRPTHYHVRSNGKYQKLYDASEEATMNHVVVYRNEQGETFTRPATEFYDIERFQEIN